MTAMVDGYSELANETVSAANGVDYAYRDTGGRGRDARLGAGGHRVCQMPAAT